MTASRQSTLTAAMTSSEVVAAVLRRYEADRDDQAEEWAALEEFTGGTGPWGSGRRADLFLVRAWRGGPRGHERVLVEVKVSRGDLLRELANPDKLAGLGRFAHRVFIAAPAGVVRTGDDLGDGVGLLEVVDGVARETRRARRRPAADVPETFFVETARRASRAEGRIRRAGDADAAAVIADLQLQVRALRRQLETAREASRRDAARLTRWLSTVADAGGVPCVCSAEIARTRDVGRNTLRHADGTDCPESRGGYATADVYEFSVRLADRIDPCVGGSEAVPSTRNGVP